LYTIAKIRPVSLEKTIVIVGIFPKITHGETLKVTGVWQEHAVYGSQIKVSHVEILTPTAIDDIRTYLSSGLIKGLGPKIAFRIIEYFQEETIHVLEKNPSRLQEVRGIGKLLSEIIAKAWQEHQTTRKLSEALILAGIRPSMIPKIEKSYGAQALLILQENPYILINEFPIEGFEIADALARSWGIAEDTPERAAACILYLLQENISRGHTYSFVEEIKRNSLSKFQITAPIWEEGLMRLFSEEAVVLVSLPQIASKDILFQKSLYDAEVGIQYRLAARSSVPLAKDESISENIVERVLRKSAIVLSSEQREALHGVLTHRVSVVTGGPGTGKTTLIKSICGLFADEGKQVRLCAPTGRAARRLFEVTGKEAETIHKMLEYSPAEGVFLVNEKEPLEADVIVVDEMSMVDVLLMHQLLKATPMTTRLILVGDVFQLPPVGPGNVLGDIVGSGKIPVYLLTEIHRQHEKSLIISNAHRVRSGQIPEIDNREEGDFYFFERSDSQSAIATILELCTKEIPRRFSIDPFSDIQILTPMHRGIVGTIQLNQLLQNALNPVSKTSALINSRLRVGDKVMHLKNNYQKEVFNGDIGMLIEMNFDEKIFKVDYQDRIVSYEFSEQDEITLAYAISVHKSQGSEYPVVVLPLTPQHAPLLQRNLLYTAVTRAKTAVVMIGSKQALKMAVENDQPDLRRSALCDFFKM